MLYLSQVSCIHRHRFSSYSIVSVVVHIHIEKIMIVKLVAMHLPWCEVLAFSLWVEADT